MSKGSTRRPPAISREAEALAWARTFHGVGKQQMSLGAFARDVLGVDLSHWQEALIDGVEAGEIGGGGIPLEPVVPPPTGSQPTT